jgi:CheY-like chemotaxis protein
MAEGTLGIYAAHEDGQVEITITGRSRTDSEMPSSGLLDDIIVPSGVSIELQRKGERVYLLIRVPSRGERKVLVIEDNPDMVHFYRRCMAGTPYRVDHLVPGSNAIEEIEAAAPDVVLLDVMLPRTDGWQLLTHLHERPSTRSIPVVVCSVVKEEELALALGAACFLAKPVQPRRLVEALDRALLQG